MTAIGRSIGRLIGRLNGTATYDYLLRCNRFKLLGNCGGNHGSVDRCNGKYSNSAIITGALGNV